ncbi:MAG: glycosyltransferase family 39 protein [Verrucomicrobia bacterium]|nr:glycosyltransferase family 39 protein [Verrucomicrobiota bacterium]
MRADSAASWLGGVLVFSVSALTLCSLPLADAVYFTGDEGMELMKGLLWSRGYALYDDVWSDQPPLLTVLLGWLFDLVGPSLLAARLMAMCFALLLFGGVFALVGQQQGVWSGGAAAILLLGSPVVMNLSVSAMQEIPAFAVGMGSAYILFRWRRRQTLSLLTLSAVIMGIALAIKFTVFLLWPAVLLELALITGTSDRSQTTSGPVTRLSAVGVWVGSSLLVAFALCWLLGCHNLGSLYKSHFVATSQSDLSRPEDYGFLWYILWHHAETVIAASIGVGLVINQKRVRQIAFPLMILITVVLVHLLHRPIWDFYYLHLAIPLAWLAGSAIGSFVRVMMAQRVVQVNPQLLSMFVCAGLTVVAFGLVFVPVAVRLDSTFKILNAMPRVKESTVLTIMKANFAEDQWIFTFPPAYAFHVGALVPPELAVLSFKRYWSGEMTNDRLIYILEAYRPKQMLIQKSDMNQRWSAYLNEKYRLAYSDACQALYLRRPELGDELGRDEGR